MASWASSILFTAELISLRSSAAIAFISPRSSAISPRSSVAIDFISPRNSAVEAVRSVFVTDASSLARIAPTIASACLDSIPAASSDRAARGYQSKRVERANKIVELHRTGLSLRQIAVVVGCGKSTVMGQLKSPRLVSDLVWVPGDFDNVKRTRLTGF